MIGLLIPALATALLMQGFLPVLARLVQDARERGGAAGCGEPCRKELNPNSAAVAQYPLRDPGPAARVALLFLVIITSLRSWVHVGFTTFIPLYYVDYLGSDPNFASMLLTIFLLAGAVGTLLGGYLSDRWGRRTVLLFSFALVIPSLLYLPSTTGVWSAVLVGWSGLVLISSFAITVVYAQELIPGHVGLASGLMLGFAVGMGGLGTLLLGNVADLWGVPAALKIVAVLPLPALLLTLLLPDSRR
jgi:FSR family fosmidomycin resistance protein-like MFS transporter